MNGWNRLFVVGAVCWAIASPFLVMKQANEPTEAIFKVCADGAYRRHGSSDSPHLDMDQYRAEQRKCIDDYVRNFVSIPTVARAMVGFSDWSLGLFAWAVLLIPLALVWVFGWLIGTVATWVAAGFRR